MHARSCSIAHRPLTKTWLFSTPQYRPCYLKLQTQKHAAFTTRSKTPTASRAYSRELLRSSFTLTAIGAGLVIAATGYIAWDSYTSPQPTSHQTHEPSLTTNSTPTFGPVDPFDMPVPGSPPTKQAPGRPETLTPEEEQKLKELWLEIGKLTGQYPETARISTDARSTSPSSVTADGASATGSAKKERKRRFGGLMSRSKNEIEPASNEDLADKHGSNREFKAALADMSKSEIRESLWEFCKDDDPDANLCRYLRARKWNVHDALVMLVSTIHWRERVMNIDTIMINGEEAAMKASKGQTEGTGGMSQKLGHDMISQLEMGKSFLHGCDKEGRPLCIVRARLHKGGEFSEESLERLTVYMIETARFMLRPPVDTATLVFDMTGFSLANMDYTPVKFMIKVFEANYPESLGAVLVYKAPWVFQGIWSIIKGWLDPVVASKINFVKDVHAMEEFIDPRNITKDLGGQEDWEYRFVAPVEGENRLMADTKRRDELKGEHEKLLKAFEQNTEDWVMGTRPDAQVRQERKQLSKQMHDMYWRRDPYIRSRSMYDRTGVLQGAGKVDFYPSPNYAAENGRNGAAAVQPSSEKVLSPAYGASANSAGGAGHSVAGLGAAPTASPGVQARNMGQDTDAKSVKSVYYDANDDVD